MSEGLLDAGALGLDAGLVARVGADFLDQGVHTRGLGRGERHVRASLGENDLGEDLRGNIGLIPARGRVRYALLTDPTGNLCREKVEGVLRSRTDAPRAFVVLDADDPTRASELCEVVLEGDW